MSRYHHAVAYIVLIIVILLLVLGPGIWVKRVLSKYSQPEDRYAGTGASLARHLLDKHGLQSVQVESSVSGDHYVELPIPAIGPFEIAELERVMPRAEELPAGTVASGVQAIVIDDEFAAHG